MVEDLRNDRWHVTFLEQGTHPLDERSDAELLTPDGVGGPVSAELSEAGILAAARSAARRAGWGGGAAAGERDAAPQGNWVRLLPPRGERSGLRGKKSFGTVTTSDIVRRVEFYLDGELVFEDKRKPFETRIDLGPEAVPHVIRIVGYDRADRRLDDDELPINQPRRNTEIGIVSVEAEAGGSYAIEAQVELVAGRRLDRVEFYRNGRRAVTMTRPPFRTVLPGPVMPGADFVRIAVYLDDGTMIEDVEFLSSDTPVAETIVNLVEVYVVVNDEEGKPITTLTQEDFVLLGARDQIPIERFAVAEEVPLVLGLAVDSSLSMEALMPDVRMAAARFLGNTLTKIDQAFLVDFDTRPRLISDTTARVRDLIGSLNKIRADGRTALYDAMEFSLVHLAPGPGPPRPGGAYGRRRHRQPEQLPQDVQDRQKHRRPDLRDQHEPGPGPEGTRPPKTRHGGDLQGQRRPRLLRRRHGRRALGLRAHRQRTPQPVHARVLDERAPDFE